MTATLGTMPDLFARLSHLNWHNDSLQRARNAVADCDLVLLRGKFTLETFTIKPGLAISRAASMIWARKGNSRVRLYVTPRANDRL